ncbi:hypothetical protein RhiLY_10831 [Ceratobasidium sp. AG-Ba]|nr:hypothetical protein RhiLY_10831 [Ceratobasidium sp. AG-Ba]
MSTETLSPVDHDIDFKFESGVYAITGTIKEGTTWLDAEWTLTNPPGNTVTLLTFSGDINKGIKGEFNINVERGEVHVTPKDKDHAQMKWETFSAYTANIKEISMISTS